MNSRPLLLALVLTACATQKASHGEKAPPEPAAPAAAPAKAPPAAAATKADDRVAEADYQLRETTLSFDEQGRLTVTTREVFRVLSADPSEGWKTLSASFRPGLQAPPVLTAKVITTDGVVTQLDPKTIVESPVASELPDVYSDAKELKAPLPAIGPGSLVDMTVVTRELKPVTPYGTALVWNLAVMTPLKKDRLVIDYPASLPLQTDVEQVGQPLQRTTAGDRVQLKLERANVKAWERAEDFAPADAMDWPRVAVATGKSWNAVARGYGAAISHKVALNPALTKTVKQLTHNVKDKKERLARLLRWEREQVRYTGLEVAEAGTIPFTPAETISRRYGDCKDMAVLLAAMLKEAGIEAKVALVYASVLPDVPEKLPGIGHFNHAIVYLPKLNLWVDPTERFAAPGQLGSVTQGRFALVIDDGTRGLTRTPEAKSQDNRLVVKSEVHLARFGPGKLSRVRETVGLALQQRRQVTFESEESFAKMCKQIAKDSYHSKGEPVFSHSAPLDFTVPFRESLEVPDTDGVDTSLVDAAVRVDTASLLEPLPFELEADEKEVKQPDQLEKERRKTPLLFPQPFQTEYTLKVVPPSGYQLKKLPEGIDQKVGPSHVSMTTTQDPKGVVTVTLRFDSGPRRWSAEDVETVKRELPRVLGNVPPVVLSNHAIALADQGKLLEAVEAARALVKAEPKEPMHHLTMARVLLVAHAGLGARAEAKRATELAPKLAVAWATLGEMDQHNLLGQKFTYGFDRPGAIAAYTRASELDPEDADIGTGLIDSYLMNEHGVMFGRGSQVEPGLERLAAWRQKHGNRIDDWYAEALFRAGKYKELAELGPKLALSDRGAGAWVAAVAAGQSPERAVKLIERELRGHDAEKVSAATTVLMLDARKYREFSTFTTELIRSSGEQLNAEQKAFFGLLDRLRPAESLGLKPDDPRSLLINLAQVEFSEDDGAATRLFTGKPDKLSEEYVKGLRTAAGKVDQSGKNREMAADMFVAMMEVKIESQLPFGDLLLISSPMFPKLTLRVVASKQPEGWKLHRATFDNTVWAEGIEKAVAAHDTQGALVLVRSVAQLHQQDQLGGWVGGILREVQAKPEDLLLAAGVLHSFGSKPARAVDLLAKPYETSKSREVEQRRTLALALGNAYERAEKWPELEHFASSLAADRDLAKMAPPFRGVALRHQGRFTEHREALEAELARSPDDERLLAAIAQVARQEGRFDLSTKAGLRLVELNSNPAENLAEVAFDAMYSKVDATALERAQKARMMEQQNPNVLATLAALYAEAGRVDEAHEVLKVRLANAEEKDLANRSWFALGRVAEALKLPEVATDAYGRVKPAEEGLDRLHALARQRMQALAAR